MKYNNPVNKRFVEAVESLIKSGVARSKSEIATQLKIKPNSLSEILGYRQGVTTEILNSAFEAYRISPLFVITGIGEVIYSGEVHKTADPLVVITDNQGNEKIAMVDVKAAAGYARGHLTPTMMANLPTFSLPGNEWNNATFRCFEVAGDSMLPTINPGDWVIGKYLDQWPTSIREGEVHIVVTENEILIKRLLNRIQERGKIILKSDNISYPLFELEATEIKEIWITKRLISPLFSNKNQDIYQQIELLQADVFEIKNKLNWSSKDK